MARTTMLLKGLGVAALAVALADMLQWTWGTWPDILVDFGRELYVPWQLSQGQSLYRDIASFNGPLSPYVNALIFKVFGVSLRVLVLWNIVVTVALTALLHHAIRQVSSWWTATAACLVFVLLFACGQYAFIGNYNYICPYSHEIVHGVTLSILGLALLWQAPRRGRLMILLGGLAVGLTFLTKVEVFLAAAVTAAITLASMVWVQRSPLAEALKSGGTFLAGALVPPAAAFALLSLAMPASVAFHGLTASLLQIGNSELSRLVFYRQVMGTDDIRGNLGLIVRYACCVGIFLGSLAAIAGACRGPSRKYWALAAGLGATVGTALWFCWKQRLVVTGWLLLPRPLPLAMLGIGVVLLAQLLRLRDRPMLAQRRVRQLSLVVLAGLLMAKLILSVGLMHYGFALAMPAVLIVVVILLEWIPNRLHRAGRAGLVFAVPALAALAAVVAIYLDVQSMYRRGKIVSVPDPRGGVILTDVQRGQQVNEVVHELSVVSKPGQTLAVLPEGVMINYLSGMSNPTTYINFMPPEFIVFGRDAMARAFREHPPEFVVLLPRDVREYGYRQFGLDYGQELFAWIGANYREIWRLQPHGQEQARLLARVNAGTPE